MSKFEKFILAGMIVVIIILLILLIGWFDATASSNPVYIVHDVMPNGDFVMCSPSEKDCHSRALARCDDPDSIAPPVGTSCQLLYGGRFDCGEYQHPFYVSDLQHPFKAFLPGVGK